MFGRNERSNFPPLTTPPLGRGFESHGGIGFVHFLVRLKHKSDHKNMKRMESLLLVEEIPEHYTDICVMNVNTTGERTVSNLTFKGRYQAVSKLTCSHLVWIEGR